VENQPAEHLRDRGAREAFVQDRYVEIFRWFCRLTGCPERSADLTQETFASFWQALDRRPPGVCPRTWLFAIGRNLWRKQARDRKGFEPVLLGNIPGKEPAAEDRLDDGEFRQAAERAVRQLPEELREAFTLRFWQEFSYEQIGAVQGISPDLARWRYFTARQRLHQKLAAWEPDSLRNKGGRHAR
jgi:RNA polymerase sigma-70 factor (ECF subfamily)